MRTKGPNGQWSPLAPPATTPPGHMLNSVGVRIDLDEMLYRIAHEATEIRNGPIHHHRQAAGYVPKFPKATRTHCANGHELTPDNVLFWHPRDRAMRTVCRECQRQRKRKAAA